MKQLSILILVSFLASIQAQDIDTIALVPIVRLFPVQPQQNDPPPSPAPSQPETVPSPTKPQDNLRPQRPIQLTTPPPIKDQVVRTNFADINKDGYQAYFAATEAFRSLQAIGRATCPNCSVINGVAFRQYGAQRYLSSQDFLLSMVEAPSPSQHSLFKANQNVDGTWSFQTSKGEYLSVMSDIKYVRVSPTWGSFERFYMERKDDYVYIQSAVIYRHFWVLEQDNLLLEMDQATRWVMEIWPDKMVGWN